MNTYRRVSKTKELSTGVCVVLIIIIVSSLSGVCTAQDTPASQEKPVPEEKASPEEKPAPETEIVPLSEVAQRAQKIMDLVDKTLKSVIEEPQINVIEEELPLNADAFYKNAAEAAQVIDSEPTRYQLIDLNHRWDINLEGLEKKRKILTDHTKVIESDLESLRKLKEIWQSTKDTAKDTEIPEVVLRRIDETVTVIGDGEKRIIDRQKILLMIQDEVTRKESIASGILDRIRQVQDELRTKLFMAQDLPLWTAIIYESSDDVSLIQSVSDSFEKSIKSIKEFPKGRENQITVHGLITLFILISILYLKFSSRRWSSDDPRRTSSSVLIKYPFSSTVLISLIITFWTFPRVSSAVLPIRGILAVIAIVRLIPQLLPVEFRYIPYVMAGFYCVDQLRDMAGDVVLFEHVVFTLELAAGIVTAVLLIRRSENISFSRSPIWEALICFGVRVSLGGLIVSFIAVIFGYTSLGKFIGDTTIGAFYITIAIFGSMRIVQMLVIPFLHSKRSQRIRMINQNFGLLEKRINQFLAFGALIVWSYIILTDVGVYGKLKMFIIDVLGLSFKIGALSFSVGNIIAFPVTVISAFALSRLVRFVLEEDIFPRINIKRGISYAISSSVHYAILLIGFVLALAAAGIDLNRFNVLAGALGIGLGFGLQNVVGNFVAGLILLYERPIQIGDTIESEHIMGIVKRIGIRSSTITTFQGAELIIPNGMLTTERIINWTLSDKKKRMEIRVPIAYGADPEHVLKILKDTALTHPKVLDDPAPFSIITDFKEYSIDLELRAWTEDIDSFSSIRSSLILDVTRALAKEGVAIPLPQRFIHVSKGEPFGVEEE